MVLANYFDQDSDSGYKIISRDMIQMLEEHVPHSLGTVLYLEMAYAMMAPYWEPGSLSPQGVESVAKGLTIMRLWNKYLEISCLLLYPKPKSKHDPTKRGMFISQQAYESLELQCAAAIIYQLTLYIHAPDKGSEFPSPCNISTISLERFIVQTQNKTTHFQGTNQEPTFAETLDRVSKIHFNLSTPKELSSNNIKVDALTNRKKIINKNFHYHNQVNFTYPPTIDEFREELKETFLQGTRKAQTEMERLPVKFKEVLLNADAWAKKVDGVPWNVNHQFPW